jgi:hypothetical protein
MRSPQASNMNYGLMLSCKVEDKLLLIQRPEDWSHADEAQAYERCLKEVLDENGVAWADGNIRMGDYILLSKQRCKRPYGSSLIRAQLTRIPECRPTACWTQPPKWSSHLRSALCNSPRG